MQKGIAVNSVRIKDAVKSVLKPSLRVISERNSKKHNRCPKLYRKPVHFFLNEATGGIIFVAGKWSDLQPHTLQDIRNLLHSLAFLTIMSQTADPAHGSGSSHMSQVSSSGASSIPGEIKNSFRNTRRCIGCCRKYFSGRAAVRTYGGNNFHNQLSVPPGAAYVICGINVPVPIPA